MNAMWLTILISVGVLLLAFSLIAIRLWMLKDGEFKGTCSSNNPLLKDESGSCSVCGGNVEKCESSRA